MMKKLLIIALCAVIPMVGFAQKKAKKGKKKRGGGGGEFVKISCLNSGQLPTKSETPPDLHPKIFFCTFANVEECPDLSTPSAKGSGHGLIK